VNAQYSHRSTNGIRKYQRSTTGIEDHQKT